MQLGSTPALGAGSRRFKSCHSDDGLVLSRLLVGGYPACGVGSSASPLMRLSYSGHYSCFPSRSRGFDSRQPLSWVLGMVRRRVLARDCSRYTLTRVTVQRGDSPWLRTCACLLLCSLFTLLTRDNSSTKIPAMLRTARVRSAKPFIAGSTPVIASLD